MLSLQLALASNFVFEGPCVSERVSDLERRTVISKHGLTHDLDRRKSLFQKCVMEFLQTEGASLLFFIVSP